MSGTWCVLDVMRGNQILYYDSLFFHQDHSKNQNVCRMIIREKSAVVIQTQEKAKRYYDMMMMTMSVSR